MSRQHPVATHDDRGVASASAFPCDRAANAVIAVPPDSTSRRNFLRIIAGGGGGLLLGVALPMLAPANEIVADNSTDSDFAPDAFIRIAPSGQVTFVMPRVEMGQGTYTSISMLIAEELETHPQTTSCIAIRSSAVRSPGRRHRYAARGCPCARRARHAARFWSMPLRNHGMSIRPPARQRMAR
jgi:CO/xanthine dehydrogenase Mo-binding subunit